MTSVTKVYTKQCAWCWPRRVYATHTAFYPAWNEYRPRVYGVCEACARRLRARTAVPFIDRKRS